MKTPAIPIPVLAVNQQTQSLPQTQSGINFSIDPPGRVDSNDFEYLYNRHRYSFGP